VKLAKFAQKVENPGNFPYMQIRGSVEGLVAFWTDKRLDLKLDSCVVKCLQTYFYNLLANLSFSN
jgi:hypothetical protein